MPLRCGLACSALDNFVHVPIVYTPAFYFFTGLLRGDGWEETMKVLRKCAVPSISACWVMWIPYQTVNFSVVPEKYRVIFMQVGNLVWNVILDFIANNTPDDDVQVELQEPIKKKKELWTYEADKVDPMVPAASLRTPPSGE